MPTYKDNFVFSLSDKNKTDLQIVSVLDKRTGYVVRTALSNDDKQTPSIMAFAGARFSRSSDTSEDIFSEIKDSGKNAQEKLASIFRNYGHASVADMAQLFAYVENVPMIYEAKFFYETSVGGGQARSTRFQDFNNPNFVDLDTFATKKDEIKNFESLNQDFLNLQQFSLEKYNKWVEILTQKYIEVYQIDQNNKKEMGALKARVFDSARYFLLSGLTNRTSLAWITSAREWARIISIMKSAKDINLNYLGEQLEVLFAPDKDFADSIGYLPEAPDLIRYTGADETTTNNLVALKEFLNEIEFETIAKFNTQFKYQDIKVDVYGENYTGSSKAVAQNIQTIYPNVDESWLLDWVSALGEPMKKRISQILLAGFNHHKQMGNQFRTNVHTYVLTCSIAETRDLNRHRAWGRFIPMLSTDTDPFASFYDGYTLPLYLTDNAELKIERSEFEADLLKYYTLLEEFWFKIKDIQQIPQTLIWEILPFAHVMKLWLHGSPKEISYMTQLRVRPGGHINYRVLAHLIAQEAARIDPFLSALDFGMQNKPDPSSRKEFLDRS